MSTASTSTITRHRFAMAHFASTSIFPLLLIGKLWPHATKMAIANLCLVIVEVLTVLMIVVSFSAHHEGIFIECYLYILFFHTGQFDFHRHHIRRFMDIGQGAPCHRALEYRLLALPQRILQQLAIMTIHLLL